MLRFLKWAWLLRTLRRTVRQNPHARELVAATQRLSWRQRLIFVRSLAQDPRVPMYVRAAPLLVVLYMISPLDLVPDFIPILGQLDDAAVIGFAYKLFERGVAPELLREHAERAALL